MTDDASGAVRQDLFLMSCVGTDRTGARRRTRDVSVPQEHGLESKRVRVSALHRRGDHGRGPVFLCER
jgi:hypothetical protein